MAKGVAAVPAPSNRAKWPYRAAQPVRSRRVVKAPARTPRGVRSTQPEPPRFRITRLQARVAFVAALALMLVSAGWWSFHSPLLTITHVSVSGADRLTPSRVRAAAAVEGDSVFGLDLHAAEARVGALPEVKSASVRKDGRNGVAITIEERTPWTAWTMNGVNVAIDDEGYVLDGQPPEGVPAIIELEPQRVLKPGDRVDPGAIELASRLVRESETVLGRRVELMAYRQESGLTVLLSGAEVNGDPLWVTFGDSRDYDYKVAALYVLMEQARDEDLELNSVDLRFGDRLSFN